MAGSGNPGNWAPALLGVSVLILLLVPPLDTTSLAGRASTTDLRPHPLPPRSSGPALGSPTSGLPARAGLDPAPATNLRGSARPSGPATGVASTSGPWTNLTPGSSVAPSGRRFASMAYDAADQYVVLFGGDIGGGDASDTWTFAGGHWTKLTTSTAPSARRGAAFVYDAADHDLVLFGGIDPTNSVFLRDTWTFAGGNWTDRTPASLNASNSPSGRYVAQFAYDATDGNALLFGGCTQLGCVGTLSDTWTFGNGTWTNVTSRVGTSPSGRGGGAMLWDPSESAVLLYGGTAPTSTHLNDTWTFSSGAWTRHFPPASTGFRGDAYVAYDPSDASVVLFGGLLDYSGGGGNYINGETWLFHSGNWSDLGSSLTVSPSARWALESTGAYDARDGHDVLFGGGSASGVYLNDTWSFGLSPLGAAASGAPTQGEAPLRVNFSGIAAGGAGGDRYAWAFGDGSPNATGASLSHVYAQRGNYTATFSVTDVAGEQAFAIVNISVAAPLSAVLTAGPLIGVAPLVVNASAAPSGGSAPYSVSWGFGDGTTANGPLSTNHTYPAPGAYTLTLAVTDRGGFVVHRSVSVRVVAALQVQGSESIGPGEAPQWVNFSGATSGGFGPLGFDWTFGDGNRSASENASHRFERAGNFSVDFQATDALGEVAAMHYSLQIARAIEVNLSANPGDVSAGGTIHLATKLTGGVAPFTFTWSGLPPECPGPQNATLDCRSSTVGEYGVEVTVTDHLGRTANASRLIRVDAASPHPAQSGPFGLPVGEAYVVFGLAVGLAVGAAVWRVAVSAGRRRPPPGPPPVSSGTDPSAPGSPPDASGWTAPAGVDPSDPADVPTTSVPGASPTLPLSDQILLHLYRQGRLDESETATLAFTQEGIARALARPQNVFAKALGRLEGSGRVVTDVRHVRGTGRRRKVYRLTAEGEAAAVQLQPDGRH